MADLPTPAPAAGRGDARRARLATARLYLCTPRRPDLLAFARIVLDAGVDVLQLRDKHPGAPLEAAEELALSAGLRELCAGAGALFATNDRADLAVLAGSDVLHLGQGDLTPAQARSLVGPDVLIGRSTHAASEVDAAVADPDVDYFCAGPTWPTPTKPGRPAPGLGLLRHAAQQGAERTWFAIGGIDRPERISEVRAAGASRIVVVRLLTEAADPGAVAREVSSLLRR